MLGHQLPAKPQSASAVSKWERMTAPPQRLVGCAFLMDMALGAVSLSVQFVGVALGAGPGMLGLLGGLGGGTYTLMCLLNSRLVNRLGPRYTARAAALLMVVVWLLMAQVRSIGPLLGLAVASGALMAFFWPPMVVWLASLTSGQDRGLGRVLGLFNISWTGGLLVGTVVAGALWDWMAGSSFYYSAGGAIIILILLQLTPGGWGSRDAGPAETTLPGREAPHPNRQRLLVAGRIATFTGFFAIGIVRTLFPKLGNELGYSNQLVGWAVGAPYLCAMLIFGASGTTTRWHYRPAKLWVAMLAGIVSMVIAACAQTPAQFLTGFFLVGLSTGVGYLASQFYGLQGPPEHRAASIGYHEAAVGSGIVLGPILGGLVAAWAGNIHAAFVLGAAVMLLAGVVQLAVWWAMARRT